MTVWYNEIDPFAAQWLRNLISAGHIAAGIVDERPIQEIEAFELFEYTQCHFFAGVGVWSLALRRAGWGDDRPIWTGSCPCQPFSNAGKKKGFSDDRHLWPYWEKLIGQRKPPVVVGEQVDSALDWIDLVSTDLENQDYAFGAGIIPAAGFGGAHIRHRTYFVGLADFECRTTERYRYELGEPQSLLQGEASERERIRNDFRYVSSIGGMGKSDCARSFERDERPTSLGYGDSFIAAGSVERLADDDDDAGSQGRTGMPECPNKLVIRSGSAASGLGDSQGQRRLRRTHDRNEGRRECAPRQTDEIGFSQYANGSLCNTREIRSGDNDYDWLLCRNPAGESVWRPVESGTFPLVNETPQRVGRLRAYGNALDAETATQFCSAVKEICDEYGV